MKFLILNFRFSSLLVLLSVAFSTLCFENAFSIACENSNEITPQLKERIAILYFIPSDLPQDPSTVYSQQELQSHYLNLCTSTVQKFWLENSHGKYQFTGNAYVSNLNLTRAQIAEGARPGDSLVAALNLKLGARGFEIPNFDPSQYDMLIIFAADKLETTGCTLCRFGGGANRGVLTFNGKSYTKKYISLVNLHHNRDYGFLYYNPNQPYKGKYNGEEISYPDLDLWSNDSTILHEWAHTLGLGAHASYLHTPQTPLDGEIYFDNLIYGYMGQDYGNYFDVLGSSTGHYALDLNAAYQDKMNWFSKNDLVQINKTTFDVFITPLEGNETKRAVKIIPPSAVKLNFSKQAADQWQNDINRISNGAVFYVEYRRPFGFDKHLEHAYLNKNTDGLLINLMMNGDLLSSEKHSYLLNMSPKTEKLEVYNGSEQDNHLSALQAGYQFYDPHSQVLIKNIRPNGDQGITFDVLLGADIPSDTPPGVSSDI